MAIEPGARFECDARAHRPHDSAHAFKIPTCSTPDRETGGNELLRPGRQHAPGAGRKIGSVHVKVQSKDQAICRKYRQPYPRLSFQLDRSSCRASEAGRSQVSHGPAEAEYPAVEHGASIEVKCAGRLAFEVARGVQSLPH